jgi:sulfite reductase (NADPH) flavoprotein alpha-component
MIRILHRWPALIALAFITTLAVSGAILALYPALDAATTPAAQPGQTVAELAAKALALHPQLDQIRRAPSGKITLWWFEGNIAASSVFDPATGQDAGSADAPALQTWMTEFHRALFLDDTGRWLTAVAALAMLVLAVTGSMLIAARMGGWGKWFTRTNGPLSSRLHTELSRVAVFGLGISALTALWMTASTFGYVDAEPATPLFPATLSGQLGLPAAEMSALQSVLVADLRDLTFPALGDANDVLTLTTQAGSGYVDQGTGQMLVWADAGVMAQVEEWVYLLHTGQGAAIWGLIMGLMVLAVPALAVTGVIMWAKGRASRKLGRLAGAVGAAQADCVILVGSEGGATWGFAATLARALQGAKLRVHMAPLSSLSPQRYSAARQIIILTSTWGDGAAPTSAKGALERLTGAAPHAALAVLGFGDTNFANFCGYANEFAAKADAVGWKSLLPLATVNRQSSQEFGRWGRDLGAAMGVDLVLDHQPAKLPTMALTLVSRREYGQAAQAPAAILRFALPKYSLWQQLTRTGFAGFQAGDLLAIVPQGESLPRYYSLCSGKGDGFVEIAVRKVQGGLCSTQLLNLAVGHTIDAALHENPTFRLDRAKTPLIVIGAGTGIGPLVGFTRAQGRRRPIHMWFGARAPETDFLYGEELEEWYNSGQLAGLTCAFSRSGPKTYVQDALRQDGADLRDLVRRGAKVMVCGGRDMAQGVQAALAEALAPLGLTPAQLKMQGRYVEDVY